MRRKKLRPTRFSNLPEEMASDLPVEMATDLPVEMATDLSKEMAGNIRPTKFSDLPEEMAGNIFSRLPIRNLLQLKSVSKTWFNLISSRWFISMQLQQSISDSTRHYLLLVNEFESPSFIFCPIRSPNIRSNLGEFLKFCPTLLVGSINGLVCMASMGQGRFCIIWNPSTRQHRILPKNSIIADRKKVVQVTFGLGYEPNSDDYKVVRALNFSAADQEMPSTRVEVYSVNSDTWKEVEIDFPFNTHRKNCDVILNGFTYWLVKKGNGNEKAYVASFDMRREVFQQITLPDVEFECYSAINFKGCLGLLVYGPNLEVNKCLQVWMPEDQRSGGVWSKKFTFNIDFLISRHWGLANGYIIVKNCPNLPFLYDPETKEMKIIGISHLDGVHYFVESMVTIKKSRRTRRSDAKKLK